MSRAGGDPKKVNVLTPHSSIESTPKDPSALQRASGSLLSSAQEAREQIFGTGEFEGQNPLTRGVDLSATVTSAIPKAVVSATPGFVRSGLEKVGEGISSVVNFLGEKLGSTDVAQRFVEQHPEAATALEQAVKTTGALAETGANIVGVGGTAQMTRSSFSRLRAFEIPRLGSETSLFRTAPKSVDDVIQQADQNITKQFDDLIAQGKTAEARALAESTAPKTSIVEKWTSIRPDIKARIQGKPELMREYFDITHARNVNDTLPSVQEYGASYVQKAQSTMEDVLNATGGDIGRVRQKLGSIRVETPTAQSINQKFSDALQKLNLEVRNGQVVQIRGTQSRLQGSGDLKVLNDIYNEMKVWNQNPSLTNTIDLRTNLDGKINFAKTQREVSNSVDPFSRVMRTELKNAAEQVVGKTNAADVRKYSQFMDALNDLRSYTDRRAGSEYLLRLVLSGRGAEARRIIQTVKENTGIDLMDHATMMQISTELIANEAQKNLFRQEITKAGLDTARLLGGDPTGAVGTLFQKGADRFLDKEKIFLEAAGQEKKGLIQSVIDRIKSTPNKQGGVIKIGSEPKKAPLLQSKRQGVSFIDDTTFSEIVKKIDGDDFSIMNDFLKAKGLKLSDPRLEEAVNLVETIKKSNLKKLGELDPFDVDHIRELFQDVVSEIVARK